MGDGPLIKHENEPFSGVSRKDLGIGKVNSICQTKNRRDMLDLNRITVQQSSEVKTGLSEFKSKQSESFLESHGQAFSFEHIQKTNNFSNANNTKRYWT